MRYEVPTSPPPPFRSSELGVRLTPNRAHSSSILERSYMGTTYTPWLLYVRMLRRFRRILPTHRFVMGRSYSWP